MHSLKLAALIAITLAVAPAVQAQGLPYDFKTVTCDEIIAHADDNAATKMVAASLYAHGQHMGNRCIEVDMVRAFQLWAELGSVASMKTTLREIEMRANAGNPRAQSWLRKLQAAGFIEKTRESLSY